MRTSSSWQGRHLGGKSGLSSDCSHNFICSFRNMGYNADCSNLMITWSQFCKEPLPDRSFTFWEWFYAVMKLTKEDLRGMWIDGWVNMWSESKMSWDNNKSEIVEVDIKSGSGHCSASSLVRRQRSSSNLVTLEHSSLDSQILSSVESQSRGAHVRWTEADIIENVF